MLCRIRQMLICFFFFFFSVDLQVELVMYPVVLISAIAIALTSPMANAATEGNAKALQKIAPLEYESYIHSLNTSEEPDRFRTPYDPIFSINYGKMYNYRDMQSGKRSHGQWAALLTDSGNAFFAIVPIVRL